MKTNRIIRKALAVVGIFCSLSTVFTPFASYADSSETSINLVIDAIPIEVEVSSDPIIISPGQIGTGSIRTTITSSLPYSISMRADKTALTNDSSYEIPASSNITAGVSGWGVKCTSASTVTCNKTNYTALTTNDVVFASNSSNVVDASYDFMVGVSVAPSIPAGTYSTEITTTVTVN